MSIVLSIKPNMSDLLKTILVTFAAVSIIMPTQSISDGTLLQINPDEEQAENKRSGKSFIGSVQYIPENVYGGAGNIPAGQFYPIFPRYQHQQQYPSFGYPGVNQQFYRIPQNYA